jgi:surface antigen
MTSFTMTLGEAGMPEVTFTHDYPYAGLPAREYDHMGGFLTRECCSFAAWWLNRHAEVPFDGLYGGQVWEDAQTWAVCAEKAGLCVDDNPEPGSIAWFGPQADKSEASNRRGHVGIVLATQGEKVWLQDYNWLAWSYRVHWLNWRALGGRFIHFPQPDLNARAQARMRTELVLEACEQRYGHALHDARRKRP